MLIRGNKKPHSTATIPDPMRARLLRTLPAASAGLELFLAQSHCGVKGKGSCVYKSLQSRGADHMTPRGLAEHGSGCSRATLSRASRAFPECHAVIYRKTSQALSCVRRTYELRPRETSSIRETSRIRSRANDGLAKRRSMKCSFCGVSTPDVFINRKINKSSYRASYLLTPGL